VPDKTRSRRLYACVSRTHKGRDYNQIDVFLVAHKTAMNGSAKTHPNKAARRFTLDVLP